MKEMFYICSKQQNMDLRFDKIIRKIRKDQGWTLDRMAGFLGIAKGTLSMIENGHSDPRNKNELLKKLNSLGDYDFSLSAKSGETIVSVPLFESNLTVTKK